MLNFTELVQFRCAFYRVVHLSCLNVCTFRLCLRHQVECYCNYVIKLRLIQRSSRGPNPRQQQIQMRVNITCSFPMLKNYITYKIVMAEFGFFNKIVHLWISKNEFGTSSLEPGQLHPVILFTTLYSIIYSKKQMLTLKLNYLFFRVWCQTFKSIVWKTSQYCVLFTKSGCKTQFAI